MVEHVWKLTGFNRHPSLIQTVTSELLPLLEEGKPLEIATVPCATGVEALALAFELEKRGVDFSVSGFDVDGLAIETARNGEYILNPMSHQIVGDPRSGYSYQGSNLTSEMRQALFDELRGICGDRVILKPSFTRKAAYIILGIQELPLRDFDIILCLNFLKYFTDDRYSGNLPPLEVVSKRLHQANKFGGALLIDPNADKSQTVRESLASQGYLRMREGAYIKS